LLTHGDHYTHLADLKSYLEADQRCPSCTPIRTPGRASFTLNLASSGKFSSDHTIGEYAARIWKVEACPVP
jgi:glycogen phosphorylase